MTDRADGKIIETCEHCNRAVSYGERNELPQALGHTTVRHLQDFLTPSRHIHLATNSGYYFYPDTSSEEAATNEHIYYKRFGDFLRYEIYGKSKKESEMQEANMAAPDSGPSIPTRAHILRAAEHLTCGDRNAQYGPPEKNFREIAEGWSLILGVTVEPRKVALCMAWLKTLRACTAPGLDSEIDGAAYFAIAGELRDAST